MKQHAQRRLLLALSLGMVGLVSGCGLVGGKVGSSGVRGVVVSGPVSVSPAVVPYAVVTAQALVPTVSDASDENTDVLLAYTTPLAQTQADGLGRFALTLSAGTYRMTATNPQASSSASATPVTVTVPTNGYVQANLTCPASP